MRLPLTILSFAILSGCAKKPGSYEMQAANSNATGDAATQAADLWELRGEKEKLLESLSLYEQVLANDPENRDAAYHLLRGWYFIGDAHETETEAKLAAWDKAIAFGDTCLNINSSYKATLEKSGSKSEAVMLATVDDVPCIYWTASSLGKWAKTTGLPALLKHKQTVFDFVTRVETLEPDYFHGAVYRYWGAYYSGLPSFAGQDLNRSKEMFEKAIELAPENLANRVLYANYWAEKSQTYETFDEMLQYVMAADTTVLTEELGPENEAEKVKANGLFENRSEKFAGEIPAPKELQNMPPQRAPEPEPEPLRKRDMEPTAGGEEVLAPEEGSTPETAEDQPTELKIIETETPENKE